MLLLSAIYHVYLSAAQPPVLLLFLVSGLLPYYHSAQQNIYFLLESLVGVSVLPDI